MNAELPVLTNPKMAVVVSRPHSRLSMFCYIIWHSMQIFQFMQAVIEFRLGYPNMKWRNVYKVLLLCLHACVG